MDDLIAFFKYAQLPTEPVKLSQGETIVDCKKFVEKHLSYVAHYGVEKSAPYWERLQKLKQKLNPKPIYK